MISYERVGVSTLTWRGSDTITCLRRACELGFHGVDIGVVPWHDFGPEDLVVRYSEIVEPIVDEIAKTGLTVFTLNAGMLSVSSPTVDEEIDALGRFARDVSATAGVTIGVPNRIGTDAVDESVALDYVRRVTEGVARHGVAYLPETHQHQWSDSPAWMRALIARYQGFGITLDASHYLAYGYEVEEFADLYPNTRHAHLRACGNSGAESIQVTLEACNPLVYACIESMDASGYQGTYSFEIIEGIGIQHAEQETIRMRDSLRDRGLLAR